MVAKMNDQDKKRVECRSCGRVLTQVELGGGLQGYYSATEGPMCRTCHNFYKSWVRGNETVPKIRSTNSFVVFIAASLVIVAIMLGYVIYQNNQLANRLHSLESTLDSVWDKTDEIWGNQL